MLCASGLSLGTSQTLFSISVEFSSMHDFTFHFFSSHFHFRQSSELYIYSIQSGLALYLKISAGLEATVVLTPVQGITSITYSTFIRS